jgi:lipopolysaccharide export system permease protein
MSILARYVLRQHLIPASAGLAIFYFVLSMDFLVDYLNLFIAKGVPGLFVLEAFGLSLAWMTLLAVPMAVMVAVLTAFGRLAGDNEITAAKASGVNVFSLMLPVLFAALLITFGLFEFGDRLLPAANYRLKGLLVDIHHIKPLATIEPRVLTELPGGYSVFIDSMDSETSEVFSVKIHRVSADEPPQTIVAESGVLSMDSANDVLRVELLNGEILEADADDPTKFHRLLFDKHVINIAQGGSSLIRSERSRRGDRELSVAELASRRDANRAEAATGIDDLRSLLSSHTDDLLAMSRGEIEFQSNRELRDARSELMRKAQGELRGIAGSSKKARRLDVEFHKKLSIPFSCMVFVLLGAPLGLRSRRGGIGIGAGIGILVFLVYYLFLMGGEQLGDRGYVDPALAMWAPNLFFGAIGLFLTFSTCLEWRAAPITRIVDFIVRVPVPSRSNAK